MLKTLFVQAKHIEKLNDRIEDVLQSRQLVLLLLKDRQEKQNAMDSIAAQLLNAANNLKSKAIVLYGLKEFLLMQGIESILLPSKEELDSQDVDWLDVGDIVTGFGGATCDERGPRVIVATEEDGHRWRYLAEPEMQPRRTALDPWLQHRSWVKCNATGATTEEQMSSIESVQAAEITGLEAILESLQQQQAM